MLSQVNPWAWQPHPEVWALVLGIIGLGFYATRVIGPKYARHYHSQSAVKELVGATAGAAHGSPSLSSSLDSSALSDDASTPDAPAADGEFEIVSTKQKKYFALGVFSLYLAADWPLHDIAEQYLYSLHMVQHMLITFFIPIFFLQATPEWLARLILGGGGQERTWLGKLAKPVTAGLIFNFLAGLSHWNGIVQTSFDSGAFHFTIHLVMFSSALLMWLPVLGPLPELRLSVPGQMIYLFLMSIIPTVPAGWLTFADNVVYPAYDIPTRVFGLSVIHGQQAAGAIMKIFGGLFLWSLIAIRFFTYAGSEREADRERRIIRPLTYSDVEAEFERTTPPETE